MSFNFLKSYCDLMEKTEVPPRFQIWSGIALLLAALERRIWIHQSIYIVYPNFFIFLVAPSGLRKSTAVLKALEVLEGMPEQLNILAHKITTEALIGSLRKKNNKIAADPSGGIVVAHELANFLDRHELDRSLGPVLTALFDCARFKYQTITRGEEECNNTYLSILGGITIELLQQSLPKNAIGGGFTSRALFVYEERLPPPVAWINKDPELGSKMALLSNYLHSLKLLNGPISLDDEARDFFIADYEARYYESRQDGTLASYINRRHTHLFKTAIALMVNKDPSCQMKVEHLRGAQILLEEIEEDMPRVMELITSTDVGAKGNLIYQFIKAAGKEGVSRAVLVRRFASQMDAMELSKVLDTLQKGERIVFDTSLGKLIYRVK